MRKFIWILTGLFVHGVQAKVCSIQELNFDPKIQISKPEIVLKFQDIESNSKPAIKYDRKKKISVQVPANTFHYLKTFARRGAEELFLFENKESQIWFMSLSGNQVTIDDSPSGPANKCVECKLAAELLLHKRNKPQSSIRFADLKLPFCSHIELPEITLQGCRVVPSEKETDWGQTKSTKYSQSWYDVYFQIPKTEYSYQCSTFSWINNLRTRLPSDYQCEPVVNPTLKPASRQKKHLPKRLFEISADSLQQLLSDSTGEDFPPSVMSQVVPQARLAQAYGKFCKKHKNCVETWTGEPVLVGFNAGYGFQGVCGKSETLNIPHDFCETKDDCIWVNDCCSRSPANKNFERARPPQICPDMACPNDFVEQQLECRNLKCVGVAR